jgi:hypothetical protein
MKTQFVKINAVNVETIPPIGRNPPGHFRFFAPVGGVLWRIYPMIAATSGGTKFAAFSNNWLTPLTSERAPV